jgi:hypothetical protein
MTFFKWLTLASVFLLFSCEKGAGTFVLKGEITDLTFNQGHSSATIRLYKVPVGTQELIQIDSSVLNSNGNYQFSFLREQMEKYVIRVEKEGYFEILEDIYMSGLTLENDNTRNYETHAQSWIGIQLQNDNPENSDHFRYIKQEGLENCDACCPNTEQNFYGAQDTTIYCINNGNEVYSLFYWVIGTATSNLVSINTAAFDTSYVNISY